MPTNSRSALQQGGHSIWVVRGLAPLKVFLRVPIPSAPGVLEVLHAVLPAIALHAHGSRVQQGPVLLFTHVSVQAVVLKPVWMPQITHLNVQAVV